MGKTHKTQVNHKPKFKPKKLKKNSKGEYKTAITDLPDDKSSYYELEYPEDNFEKFDRKR
tara:strand:- start:1984 stop:2163 length:180 start_codon:yes stop_codon:yes gene_type:complete